MKKYISKLMLLSFLFHMGCSNEPKKNNVKQFKSELNCNPIQNNIICIPKEWKVIKQSELFFFAAPESDYKYTFFTVGKYNLRSHQASKRSLALPSALPLPWVCSSGRNILIMSVAG
ncbi:hypothetical protein FA048_18670 [Pedobacter polaris]|uniref:Uncharacterized protein n=1 Tax=Pedobacter polaris TaxID=2571273 RepID=A0A4U1CE43_9SPHI|nr:hypothetical protein [Pedobacter polaris]TKC04712.1 hypothetical protein FA048_18670 [Pedobacter polaris]